MKSSKEDKDIKKEDETMNVAVQSQSTNKKILLSELQESLIELNKKRSSIKNLQSSEHSSWRRLFEDEEN